MWTTLSSVEHLRNSNGITVATLSYNGRSYTATVGKSQRTFMSRTEAVRWIEGIIS